MKRSHWLLILAFIAWHCITRVLGNNTDPNWVVGWIWFGWGYEFWHLAVSLSTAIIVWGVYTLIKEMGK